MGLKIVIAIIIGVFLLVLVTSMIENGLNNINSPKISTATTSTDPVEESPTKVPTNTKSAKEPVEPEEETPTISITANGFSPSTLTISAGDIVSFLNEDSSQHWPATDKHPSHKGYPGSNIGKCGSSEENTIFDSCGGLTQGETYEFQFNEIGTWSYHDHLKPGLTGTIKVI